MKRVYVVCAILAAIGLLSSASSVSWEGRATIGSKSNFPDDGNYALSRVFSQGEIVNVYNSVNGKKTTVVISGTTDMTGILIILSPKAADDLSLKSGFDNIVRVTKNTEYIKEPPIFNDSSSSIPADPDSNPVAAVEDSLVNRELDPPEFVEPQPQPVAAVTEPEVVVDEIPIHEESPVIAEKTVPEPMESLAAPDSAELPEAIAVVPEPKEQANIFPGTLLANKETKSSVPVFEAEPELIPQKPVIENTQIAPSVVTVPSITQPKAEAMPVVPAASVSIASNIKPGAPASAAPAAKPAATVPAAPAATSDLIVVDEPVTSSIFSLVPTEDKPPVARQALPTELTAQATKSVAPPAALPSAINTEAETPVYIKYVSEALQSGSYYVQLGMYKNMVNVEKVISKYKNKYPLVLKEVDKSGGFQVLVGPLSADEYSVVLKKVQESGYPDAFLKKIP